MSRGVKFNELYEEIKIIEKSDLEEKDLKINDLIENFYKENKKELMLFSIEEVIAEVEKIKLRKYAASHPKEFELEDEER